MMNNSIIARSMLVGLMVGLICLRLSGFYFAVFTFGLSELVRNCVLWWEHNVSGTVGRWIPSANSESVYYWMLVIVSIAVIFSYLIGRSTYGLALKGRRGNRASSGLRRGGT